MADISKIKLPNNSVYDIRDHSKIADPATKSSGQYLTYNGTSWVADDIPQTAVGTLSIDSTPTNGSNNLVTSGGVYTAINNVDALPSQTGQSGKFLTTDGTDASWASVPSAPVTSVNTQTGDVVLDASDVGALPDTTTVASGTTGISIADHSTGTITGVQSSTTTASKVTLGTAISVPNVTSAGSASNWVFEDITVPIKNANATSIPNVTAAGSGSFTQGSFSGGSFTQGTDSFTANTPTTIDVTKFSGGSFTRGAFSGGSFTQGSDSFTANIPTTIDTSKFSGGSLSITNDTTSDANHHILTFSFTPASLASGFYSVGTAASFTQGSDSFTAATHANDSFTAASLASGFYSAGSAASFTQGEDTFTPATHGTDTHVHTPPTLGTAISVTGVQSTTTTASHVKSGGNGTAPTLGTAISIPNVTAATDVTVPIKDSSSTTVVTSKTHSITDTGHTHTLSVPV